MFACSIHLSGWTLVVVLGLFLAWVLAALLSLLNLWWVLRTSGSAGFQSVNLLLVLGYVGWAAVLFCGVFLNGYFVMASALFIPVCVFVHTGFLVDARRKLRTEEVLE